MIKALTIIARRTKLTYVFFNEIRPKALVFPLTIMPVKHNIAEITGSIGLTA